MKKGNIMFGVTSFIFIIAIVIYLYVIKNKKKEVGIYGSVSKDILKDAKFQADVKYFAQNLDVSKFNYTSPNSKDGPIGYFLDNVDEKDKPYISTTYSTTFSEDGRNKTFPTKFFDEPFTYEDYMLKKSDVFVFFPGGVGTFYELAFAMLVLDVRKPDYLVFIYNKDNYFQFIKNQMSFFYHNGYLRPNIYEKFKRNFLFFEDMHELVKELNAL